jgi:hypothetical protein
VWLLTTKWQNQTFVFAVNGQTGKSAGDLPMDKAAFHKWLWGLTGGSAAAIYAISYLAWLL